MNYTAIPNAAVRIVRQALVADVLESDTYYRAATVCTALAADGWLHDPECVAELENVRDSAEQVCDQLERGRWIDIDLVDELRRALDIAAVSKRRPTVIRAADLTPKD